MKQFLKSCTALTLSLAFATHALAQEPLKEIGKGEGEVSHRRLGRLYRARRDRQGL